MRIAHRFGSTRPRVQTPYHVTTKVKITAHFMLSLEPALHPSPPAIAKIGSASTCLPDREERLNKPSTKQTARGNPFVHFCTKGPRFLMSSYLAPTPLYRGPVTSMAPPLPVSYSSFSLFIR
jgi:hypothetical protein